MKKPPAAEKLFGGFGHHYSKQSSAEKEDGDLFGKLKILAGKPVVPDEFEIELSRIVRYELMKTGAKPSDDTR